MSQSPFHGAHTEGVKMIYSARPKPRATTTDSPPRKVSRPSSRKKVDSSRANTNVEQIDVELVECILARIESRLPGRIRHLTVITTDNAIVLSGECSTFYTKQIAQHTAMGVLEYERLINNIDVRVAK